MGSGAAPEFIFDQGLYYPAGADYYGFYCTGIESSSELDDHHRIFGLDGQGLPYSGFQTESLPYVYFTPSYGYAQSPNTYNPYMPSSVIGIDGQFTGTDQYFTHPSYEQPVLSTAYIPAVIQSSSDVITNSPSGSSIASHRPIKYTPSLTFTNAAATSQRVTLGSSTSESSKSSSHQNQTSVKLLKGSLVNAAPSRQSLSHGALTASGVPHATQATHHYRNGSISSVHSPLRVTMPSNNASTNLGSSVHGWATVPKLQFNGVKDGIGCPNILVEQNKCPRANKSKVECRSAIAGQAYTTKAGIITNDDQYNRDAFPVDYPDVMFFVIKSFTEDDVHKSIKYNVWSSTPVGNKKLDSAYEDAQRMSVGKLRKCPIFLFFSVNASGQFCGVAEMIGRVDFYKNMDFWQKNLWIGSFPVKWHIIKDVPNASLRHIILETFEYIPVTSSRDTQEIPYVPGLSMLKVFQNSPLNTSILDDFPYYDECERMMRGQKSRLLGGSRGHSLSLPVFVPSNGLTGTADQPPKADDKKHPNHSVDRPLNSDGEHTSVTVDQPRKDGRRMDDAIAIDLPKTGQDLNSMMSQSLEADGKEVSTGDVELPPNAELTRQRGMVDKSPVADGERTNGTFIQPNQANGCGKLSNATINLPPRSDGKQRKLAVNQRPKYDGKQPDDPIQLLSKADGEQTDGVVHPFKSDQSDANKGLMPVAVDVTSVNSVTNVDSLSNDLKVGEANCPIVSTDVVTVGSMHIHLSKHSETFHRTFMVGSLPVVDKGLKYTRKLEEVGVFFLRQGDTQGDREDGLDALTKLS